MGAVWTISQGGTFKTFDSLGLAKPHRVQQSQAEDYVTIDAPGANVDSAALWAYGTSVTIKRDNVVWFVGPVVQTPRAGSGDAEDVDYRIAGPWWYLERLVYQQLWKLWDSTLETPALGNLPKSRVILGQKLDGTRQTIAEGLAEVIDFAIAAGVPVAKGSIAGAHQIPWDEQVDITCAEAIRRLLRWQPDSCVYFDYSAQVPTFNVVRRSALGAASVSLTDGAPTQSLNIVSRDDLRIPAVVLKFEQTNTIDGVAYENVITQVYPEGSTGLELGALVMTLQLAGANIAMQKVKIETAAIADFNNLENPEKYTAALVWWKTKVPWLNDANIKDIVIDSAGRHREQGVGFGESYNYGYELIKGQIYDWMIEGSPAVTGAEINYFTAYFSYTVEQKDNEGNVTLKVKGRRVEYKCVTTSLDSGTYKRVAESTGGESVPTGIAQALFEAYNTLQFEGRLALVAEDPPETVSINNVLNITGGLAAWASMNAFIHTVEDDAETGSRIISFGPCHHLGPQDLIEFLRGNRGRVASSRWKARETGESIDAQSGLDEDVWQPFSDLTEGAGEVKEGIMRETPQGSAFTKTISITPTDISKVDADCEIKPREVPMLETNGLSWKLRQVMASASYGSAIKSLTEITVLTAFQYDTSSHTLQIKTRTCKVVDASEESAWTDAAGGQATSCP